ncbi:MAG: DivIVA domain-containing protein [Desulfobulbaceae bacterium]|nr:MAG: DivIVA domain-containing protein [Desulfobulbaceae bacterium]
MAITPQAIKDQEFQNKFRGYDPIEVKAYLELVAEEFFELLERIRTLENNAQEMDQQMALLEEMKGNLESDVQGALDSAEALRQECEEKDNANAELTKELEELHVAQADFEQERSEFEDEVSASEARVSEVDEELKKSQAEVEMLKSKISLLEDQNQELKNEEVDFKRTIGAAQKFADELKKNARDEATRLEQESERRAQELLASSEQKANQSLQSARDEIEKHRQEAFAELSRLPEEIENLNHQRKRVRDELRSILTSHLEQLNSFTEVEEHVKHYEYDELFQKIEIPEAVISPGSLESLDSQEASEMLDISETSEESEEQAPGILDDLDNINMDLDLPEEASIDQNDNNDQDDDLRNKLEQGGIAYLSDG